MKIVVDLPEEYSKHYKRIYADSDGWTYDAGKGVPLSEVTDGIKKDLLNYESDCQLSADTKTCSICTADTFKSIEKIIDKHISGKENE